METLINLLFTLIHFTGYFVFPLVIILRLVLVPCQPPLLGSLLLPKDECSRCIFQSGSCLRLIFRALLIIFEVMQMYHRAVVSTHVMLMVLVGGILKLWEASCRTFEARSTQILAGYRDLQVLEAIVNAAIRVKIFPRVLALCPLHEILATFAVIKYYKVLGGTPLIFLVFMALDCKLVDAIYCIGAGLAHRKSCKYLYDVKSRVKGKVGVRMLKSCPTLKVRFGNNFIDEVTPLVIQHFCSVQTANLLLLS